MKIFLNQMIRTWTMLTVLSLLSLSAFAQESFEEGKHYKRLSTPVRTSNPAKIELVETFSYTCTHCYTFEGLLKGYKKTLPEDVNFVRLHVSWDQMTETLARALYTSSALKVEDQTHELLFSALHVERKPIRTEKDVEAIFAKAGVDSEQFSKVYNSFSINSQVKQAAAKIRGYKIDSTPQLVVNGEYVISAGTGIDHKKMLEIANYLIAKVRAEKG